MKQAVGTPHAPAFTVICELSSIKREGTFSTKKGAKQQAALRMLDVVQTFSRPEEEKQIAKFNPDPIEKVIKTYHELKKSDIKPKSTRLSQRHKFFMTLPMSQRDEAYQILYHTSHSDRDMVDLVCKALHLPYDVTDVPGHKNRKQVFILRGDYDCVLIGKPDDLWPNTVEYFKVMLNFAYF